MELIILNLDGFAEPLDHYHPKSPRSTVKSIYYTKASFTIIHKTTLI